MQGAQSAPFFLLMNPRLASYLSAAAASTGSLLQAQVLYTDFDPDLVIEGNLQSLRIDVNQDSVDDFVFITEDTVLQAVNGSYAIGRLRAGGYANLNNQLLGSQPSAYGYVQKLEHGDEIGPDQRFLFAGTMALEIDGQNPFNEPWNGGAFEKYIGFRIRYTADSSHYGWIRLDVSPDARKAVIKDAAFSTLADTAIAAGFEVLSHQDQAYLLDDWITQNGQWLHFSLPEAALQTVFTLYSVNGQQLWQWRADALENSYQLPDQAGIYVLVANKKGILSRKRFLR